MITVTQTAFETSNIKGSSNVVLVVEFVNVAAVAEILLLLLLHHSSVVVVQQ